MIPDFQRPILGDGYQILYPFRQIGPHTLTPDRLQVASRPDGRPDFSLQFYRGRDPSLPPQPYALLDWRLEPRYPLEAALAQLRERHPAAHLQPATFTSGYLRLYAQGAVDLPEEMTRPVALAWNGMANARLLMRLSFDAAQFLKEVLQDEALLIVAQAELEMAGVAARLPLRIHFDPARLREALLTLTDGAGRVHRDALVSFFSSDLAALGLELQGEVGIPGELAETLADWVRIRFGAFVAAPRPDGRGYLVLDIPETGAGRAEWDLSAALETRRPLVLTLRPLDAAREVVRTAGLDAVVPPPVVVPALATGTFPIEVSANVPEVRPGVLALGVTLRSQPRPPFRPQAVIASAEFVPPDDRATVRLRLSPAEHLDYTYATFVIVEDASGFHQLDGSEIHGGDDRLLLTPDDFPVRFVVLGAERELLELATIHGRCRWTEGEIARETSFDLGTECPALAVPVPRDADEPTLEIEARSRDNGRALRMGPLPAQPLQLGLHAFPEYGPHTVVVELAPTSTASLVAVDLLPEDRAETPDAVSILAVTRAQPHKTWSYLASSPFCAGYRFRLHGDQHGGGGPWSEVRSPFEQVVVE